MPSSHRWKLRASTDPRAIPVPDDSGRMTLHTLVTDESREPLPVTATVPVAVPVIEVDEDGIDWTDDQLRVIWSALLQVSGAEADPAPGPMTLAGVAAFLHSIEGQAALDGGGGLRRANVVAPDR